MSTHNRLKQMRGSTYNEEGVQGIGVSLKFCLQVSRVKGTRDEALVTISFGKFVGEDHISLPCIVNASRSWGNTEKIINAQVCSVSRGSRKSTFFARDRL
jgi:hypothetical protein